MIKSTRISLVENEDFHLELEYNEDYFILHLPRFKPSKGAVLHLTDKLDELEKMISVTQWNHIWAGVRPDDDKIKKLIRMVGGEYMGTADNIDVYLMRGEV